MALVEMFKYWGYDSLETGTHPDGTPIYDRAIDSADVALFNELLYTSGIDKNYEDCFKIVPGEGLTIVRQPGHASLGGRPALDPNPRTVTLATGNTYYYVMESNAELEYRMAREGVLLAAETSIPPQRDENHYQIILALIDVPSGATQITADMITDLRFNNDYCGVITINANYSFEQLLITADDIHDTDTHLIPVKTGSRNFSLRGNGAYSDDVKIGKYQLTPNGENVDIEFSTVASDVSLPNSYQILNPDHASITDPQNSLKSSDGESVYSQIVASHDDDYVYEFDLVYGYDKTPMLYGSETNIDITAKIRMKRTSVLTNALELWLYDMDTNTPIPNTKRDISLPTTGTKVVTNSYYFETFADLGAQNIGLRLFATIWGALGPSLNTYIYGSDMSVAYDVDQAVIGQLTPGGIITSPGGTVQTMMTQGILDNTQDILLIKGGIEI